MINYLVNFTLCSALLLLAYQLLLKNKTTYNFNRIYLLLSVAFSLTVPLIVITRATIPAEAVNSSIQELTRLNPDPTVQHRVAYNAVAPIQTASHQPEISYTLYIVTGLYLIITLLLLCRFFKNLNTIRRSVVNNESVGYQNARLVLMVERLTPHTFLNFIFINKGEYHLNQVEADVLKHELTHARQRHSADVIFIELVQAICWFNPFIPLYRKAIQLNHEFIADAAVLDNNHDIQSYQQLLLGKINNARSLSITSQFNYSITKKRLIMMSKNTSAAAAMFARLAVIPVMAVAFILFCTKTNGQQQPAAVKQAAKPPVVTNYEDISKRRSAKPPVLFSFGDYPHTKNGAPEALVTEYKAITAKYEEGDGKSILHPNKITTEDRDKMEVIFKQMSLAQQQEQSVMFYYLAGPSAPNQPTQKQLDRWKDPKFCGVWIDDKKVANADLANYKPEDFSLASVSPLTKRAINYKNYHYQVNLMTADYYKKYRDDAIANRHKSQMAFRMLNPHFNKG